MHLRLTCARCGSRLAPAMSGLRCPRFSACGFGGHVETIQRSITSMASSPKAHA